MSTFVCEHSKIVIIRYSRISDFVLFCFKKYQYDENTDHSFVMTSYSYGLKPGFCLRYKTAVYQLHETVKLCCEMFDSHLDDDTKEIPIPDLQDIDAQDL